MKTETTALPLQPNEKTLQLVIESSPNGLIMVDHSGTIVLINKQIETMFGYKREELLRQSIEILMPQSFRSRHTEYRTDYNKTPQARSMGMGRDLFGLRKDGTQIPLEIGLNPLATPDGHFVLASVVDISDRKRLERDVLEASEMERRRIGQDLHDSLGQKLLGIGFLAKALEQELMVASPAQATELARIIPLINEAMAQTRSLARGLYAAELEVNDLPTALKQLASNIQITTKIPCEFSCEPPLQINDQIVASNLYRIAQEALNNAVKHSQANKIMVTLTQTDDTHILTIEDNGIGLPTIPENGTGIGLRVMRYRANSIGGSCEIKLNPHGGTIIRCSIPLLMHNK